MLQRAIRNEKQKCWSNLCDEIEDDVWGLGQQIVTKRIKKSDTNRIPSDIVKKEIDRLFLKHTENTWIKEYVDTEHITLLSMKDLEDALTKLKNKKASGPDGITAEVVKFIVKEDPITCLNIINEVLKSGDLPAKWTRARLVLLSRAKKVQTPADLPTTLYTECFRQTCRTLNTEQT